MVAIEVMRRGLFLLSTALGEPGKKGGGEGGWWLNRIANEKSSRLLLDRCWWLLVRNHIPRQELQRTAESSFHFASYLQAFCLLLHHTTRSSLLPQQAQPFMGAGTKLWSEVKSCCWTCIAL